MDIIRMTGGLGNQMFQYALYLKLASLGREVKFDDISEYSMENAIHYYNRNYDEVRDIRNGLRS